LARPWYRRHQERTDARREAGQRARLQVARTGAQDNDAQRYEQGSADESQDQ
jgi:hypothetical protein